MSETENKSEFSGPCPCYLKVELTPARDPNLISQCTGERPSCKACIRRHEVCKYDVREGFPSRFADMKQTSEELQRENGHLKHIFTSISSAPETEAFETLRLLGAKGDNPLSALEAAVDAGIFRHPTTVEGEVKRIDKEALAESRHKLPAKPWTSVAGDGLVSHLISDYLNRDEQDPFVHCLLLLDTELFLRDMKRGDLANSQFCSPFLVNTICGLRSVSCTLSRLPGQSQATGY